MQSAGRVCCRDQRDCCEEEHTLAIFSVAFCPTLPRSDGSALDFLRAGFRGLRRSSQLQLSGRFSNNHLKFKTESCSYRSTQMPRLSWFLHIINADWPLLGSGICRVACTVWGEGGSTSRLKSVFKDKQMEKNNNTKSFRSRRVLFCFF